MTTLTYQTISRPRFVLLAGSIFLLSIINFFSGAPQYCISSLLLLLAILSWKKKETRIFQLSLLSAIGTFAFLFSLVIWPFPLLLGIAVIPISNRILSDERLSFKWEKWGTFNRRAFLLGTIFVFLSSTALFLWFYFMHPDLTDIKKTIPNLPLPLLFLGGIGFAVANAFAEEFLFRGVMFSALEKLKMTSFQVILVQAISFGCLHINGFPRGPLGVALASIYGIMMGVLRKQSNGLLVPWFFHVFADITIVAILLIYVN